MAKRLWVILLTSLLIGLIQPSYAKGSSGQLPVSSSAQKVYQQVSNSIFAIFGKTKGEKIGAFGSAVADGKDLLATNCHVALAGSLLLVYVNGKEERGDIYYYDQKNEVPINQSDSTVGLFS